MKPGYKFARCVTKLLRSLQTLPGQMPRMKAGGRRHFRRRQRHRDEGDQDGGDRRDQQRRDYHLAPKENAQFEEYYKTQGLVPEGEWDEFLATLNKNLPCTFRITGSKGEAQELLGMIKSEFFSKLVNVQLGETSEQVEPPKCLSWYPEELAWQINLDRKVIRSCEELKKLHTFLVSETESGNISRQEAVSMIPPLLLDVQPHHKVLDMCAAPGSKTAQLLEYLHSDEGNKVPSGFVVANDSDNKRCYLMTHQVKRLASPCFMVVNHDASHMPKLMVHNQAGQEEWLKFDRILADVPCSGDGTMRKNPDVWQKWRPNIGWPLHNLQLRILRRATELAEVGGRIVYSTCSFNPIENEAVIAETIKNCQGMLELVDVSENLPGLKHTPGMTSWKVMDKQGKWHTEPPEVSTEQNEEEGRKGQQKKKSIQKTYFPPSPELAKEYGLHKCVRILPHHQDTGGFFIAVLKKTGAMPWMASSPTTEEGAAGANADDNVQSKAQESKSPDPPPHKKQKVYREDPFIYLRPDEAIWPPIKEFYGMADDFPLTQLLVRCEQGKKRNVYFTSEQIKDIVESNHDRPIKFINLGLRALSRSESQYVACDFRLAQESLRFIERFISCRRVKICKEDIITLLSQENPFLHKMTQTAQDQLATIEQGSLIFDYEPDGSPDCPKCEITLCGWRGKTSCRTFLSKNQRGHYLTLCGSELKSKIALSESQEKPRAPSGTTTNAGDDLEQPTDDVELQKDDPVDPDEDTVNSVNDTVNTDKDTEDPVEDTVDPVKGDSEELKIDGDD